MGLIVLFTHLKIILLQCFQFSVSTTINSIQTDPKNTCLNVIKVRVKNIIVDCYLKSGAKQP